MLEYIFPEEQKVYMIRFCNFYTINYLINIDTCICLVLLIACASEKWHLGRPLLCKEVWGHPLDDQIQILVQLDSAIQEVKVGSSMIWEPQSASFGFLLRTLLLHCPLGHPHAFEHHTNWTKESFYSHPILLFTTHTF